MLMKIRSGFPRKWKLDCARDAISKGDHARALKHLARSCFGAGYDPPYFELMGQALLGVGEAVNAGRFLFVSGARAPEYEEAISLFLTRHHNPQCFRQLQSQLPLRARVMWSLHQFHRTVADDLRALGWPENTQLAMEQHRRALAESAKHGESAENFIYPSQVLLLLVEACPSFRSDWEVHLNQHGNELPYIAASALAHHLLTLYRAGDTSEFAAVAAVIEKLQCEGTPWVMTFATVGVLEAVQNRWGNAGIDPQLFAVHLGPASLQSWKALNDFWAAATDA